MSNVSAARSFLRPLGVSTDTLVVGGLGHLALRHLRPPGEKAVDTWLELSALIGAPVCCLDACCGTPGQEIANGQLDASAVFSPRVDPLLACDTLAPRGAGYGGAVWADEGARLARPVVLAWAAGPCALEATVRVEFKGAGACVAAVLSVSWELRGGETAVEQLSDVAAAARQLVSKPMEPGALVDVAVDTADGGPAVRLAVGRESWSVAAPSGVSSGAAFASRTLGGAEPGRAVDVAWNWPPHPSDCVLDAQSSNDRGVALSAPVWTSRIIQLVLAALAIRVRGLATTLDVVAALARPRRPTASAE
jgi:hypothetical protein